MSKDFQCRYYHQKRVQCDIEPCVDLSCIFLKVHEDHISPEKGQVEHVLRRACKIDIAHPQIGLYLTLVPEWPR